MSNQLAYIIRDGIEADLPEVHQLVKELALFEKAPEEVITNVEIFKKDAFGERDNFKLLVACTNENKIIGICIYYIAYSSWKGRIVFLDDLIVHEPYRNKGVGKKLIQHLFDYCKKENIKQMRWQVLDWNLSAIKFYESLGAVIDKEWYTCKMNF